MGPQFKTRYQSTKQSISAVLSLLRVNVHAETLPKLLNIFQSMGDNVTLVNLLHHTDILLYPLYSAMLKERENNISDLSQQPTPQPPPASGAAVDIPQGILHIYLCTSNCVHILIMMSMLIMMSILIIMSMLIMM